ncbi:MAG TPA: metallophosphoesterase family protein [Candidatus Acidoferrales bacterium]|nr:metallophosphoesterase family protein [Candidatus Acidoferrales bacterium]
MRVLLIADIHANSAALRALPEADAVVCAGDIVGFGPDSAGVIEELQRRGAHCVRGDEDDAIANGTPQPAPPSLPVATSESRARIRASLSDAHLRWLKNLPPEVELRFDGVAVAATHAYPGDYSRYIKPTDDEIERISRAFPKCNLIVIGHTHRPGTWQKYNRIVNPGSVGLSHRAGYASYAMLEDGKVTFSDVRYDPIETIAASVRFGLSNEAHQEYVTELVNGSNRPFARLSHTRIHDGQTHF